MPSCTGMKLHDTDAPHKVCYGSVRGRIRTPAWGPPDSGSYWLSNVFIVLDEHIHNDNGSAAPSARAAIARTVQLVCAAESPAHPEVNAVIFSINCIIIVHIRQTLEGPQVAHTCYLPLLCFGPVHDVLGWTDMKILRETNYHSPGIEALMDLFASCSSLVPPPLEFCPANLPTELSQQIVRCADHDTQSALEASCRLVRDIAAEYPRVGEWTLLRCTGVTDFIAFRSSTQSQHVVRLKQMTNRPRKAMDSRLGSGMWF